MTNHKAMTIVVPIYNPGNRLIACLDSIVNQTIGHDELEAILVDDGSSDGSECLIDEYQKKYPNLFRVVHEEPSGSACKPRNVGLDMAEGEYVLCLDHDDWLGKEAVERYVNHARKWQSDIILGRAIGCNNARLKPLQAYFKPGNPSVPNASVYDKNAVSSAGPWRVFRKDFLDEHSIRYALDTWYEDLLFNFSALQYAKGVSYANDYDYYYYYSRRGLSNTSKLMIKRSDQVVKGVKALFDILRNADQDQIYPNWIAKLFGHPVFTSISRFAGSADEKTRNNASAIWEIAKGYYNDKTRDLLPLDKRIVLDTFDSRCATSKLEDLLVVSCLPLGKNANVVIKGERRDCRLDSNLIELSDLAESTVSALRVRQLQLVKLGVIDSIQWSGSSLIFDGSLFFPCSIEETHSASIRLDYHAVDLEGDIAASIFVPVALEKQAWGQRFQKMYCWSAEINAPEVFDPLLKIEGVWEMHFEVRAGGDICRIPFGVNRRRGCWDNFAQFAFSNGESIIYPDETENNALLLQQKSIDSVVKRMRVSFDEKKRSRMHVDGTLGVDNHPEVKVYAAIIPVSCSKNGVGEFWRNYPHCSLDTENASRKDKRIFGLINFAKPFEDGLLKEGRYIVVFPVELHGKTVRFVTAVEEGEANSSHRIGKTRYLMVGALNQGKYGIDVTLKR